MPLDKVLELVKEEIFLPIDLYFAKSFLDGVSQEKQGQVFLFSYLLACARQGHLALQILEADLFPSPSFLTSDIQKQEEIKKEVLLGALNLSSSLYSEVEEGTKLLKPIVKYRDLLYLQKNWLLETKFLSELKRISKGSLNIQLNVPLKVSPYLNEKQKEAVNLALTSPLCFISGGPGTGKTFTAAEIVKTFLDSLTDDQKKTVMIKIAAPTGKAAAHLEKKILKELDTSISVECGTLHSLLGIRSKNSFYEPSSTLFADLFLIDESSMIDARLFTKLLESLKEGGRLVFMGDKDQLPPVDAGSFFADCIASAEKENFSAITLKECLRVEKKELIDFALDILLGKEDVFHSSFVQFFSPSQIHVIRELIWKKCQIYFADISGDTAVFRILSCIRKGPLGVDFLNDMVLSRFLEGRADDSFFSVPILITENSESLGLMNGDMGYVTAKVSSLKKKQFTKEDKAIFPSKSYPVLLLPSFEWGYCLSVHKSQGSEYDSVIALAPHGSEAFGKEVLYTAVTRAKKEVLLFTDRETLKVLLSKSSIKASGLSQRLGFEKGSTSVAGCNPCVTGSA